MKGLIFKPKPTSYTTCEWERSREKGKRNIYIYEKERDSSEAKGGPCLFRNHPDPPLSPSPFLFSTLLSFLPSLPIGQFHCLLANSPFLSSPRSFSPLPLSWRIRANIPSLHPILRNSTFSFFILILTS